MFDVPPHRLHIYLVNNLRRLLMNNCDSQHPNEHIIDHSGLPSPTTFDNHTGSYSLLVSCSLGARRIEEGTSLAVVKEHTYTAAVTSSTTLQAANEARKDKFIRILFKSLIVNESHDLFLGMFSSLAASTCPLCDRCFFQH